MKIINTRFRTVSYVAENEAVVYPVNYEGKECGAMKISRSLANGIEENKVYSISFSNTIEGYDNVSIISNLTATDTALNAKNERFVVSGTVTDTYKFSKGVSVTIATADGDSFKGMCWNNSFSDNGLIEVGTSLEVEAAIAPNPKDGKMQFNFFPMSGAKKKKAKKADTEKAKEAESTESTKKELKNAQTEMQKLVNNLIAKGWAVENAPLSPCTAIGFQPTVNSTTNCVNIIDIRGLEAILKSDVLEQVSKKLFSLKKGVDVEYDICKKQLPAFVPMGQVNANQRTNETCSSNGLVFLDVDNIEFALCEKILSYVKENEELNSKVLLWNLSPSRKGFHLVFIPFSGVEATIVANQKHVCALINTALGCEIEPDKSCTQFSRASFLTSEYYLGGAVGVLSVDNPTVLPQIETGVVYKPSDKKMVIKRTKTVDGLPLEAGEYPDIDDVSVYIDNEDFQTLSVFAHYNKYLEGKRHEWWKNLGIRFRSKGYKTEHVQPIFDYAVEYVQLLSEFKKTVDDPIDSNEASDAFLWAFNKENWEAYSAIPTTIADKDLPLGLRKNTSIIDFIEQFSGLGEDLPELFKTNSDTFFNSEQNLHLLPFQIMSTAELSTSYTSGIKHKDYNKKTYKNALQMIIVAPSGEGKSSVSDNNKDGFGRALFNEFGHYMKNEFDNEQSTCTTLPNATNAKVKAEIFRANNNNVETPVLHTQCSEIGLFRKQQNSTHGGLDFEMMKNGFDGDSFNCATKSKDGVSGFVDSLYISALISATPTAVQDYTPKAAITDGTVNRLCFCFAQTDDYERPTMYQHYNAEAIEKYVDWARKQRGTIDMEEIFGDEAKDGINNIWSPYIKVWYTEGYGYLSDLTIRTSVNAKRIAREYYLMDLYEKGYNLIEHEGKTKVIKDNIITDLPKAEPWLIQLMRVTYEYLVFGVHTLFGERAARICCKSNIKTQKKMMYKEVYDALPNTFSREQLEAVALNLKGIKNVGKNLVGNWNKNQVWSYDSATKMYTKI